MVTPVAVENEEWQFDADGSFDKVLLEIWKKQMYTLMYRAFSKKGEEGDRYVELFVQSLGCLVGQGPGDQVYELVVGHYFGDVDVVQPDPAMITELVHRMTSDMCKSFKAGEL